MDVPGPINRVDGMDLTLRGTARARLRVGALATVAVGTALLGAAPAGAQGDTPESIACLEVIAGVPGTLLQNTATRVDHPDGTSTIELTISRASTGTGDRVLDCVWVDRKVNGRVDPDDTLQRTVADVTFTVDGGTGVARVTEVDVPTGGAGGHRVCTVAAIVAPEGASKAGAASKADAAASPRNGTPPSSPTGPALRVVEASNVSCVLGVLPVVSESSNAAALTGGGIAAVVLAGGAAWFVRSRRARTATTR
jgi:hypothetical protein